MWLELQRTGTGLWKHSVLTRPRGWGRDARGLGHWVSEHPLAPGCTVPVNSGFSPFGSKCGPWPSSISIPWDLILFYFILFYSFFFLWLHLQHMEVPRLGLQWELYPPAYATATATPDLSCIGSLHHSSQQRWILCPLREARDQTCILMATSWVPNPLSHNGNFFLIFFNLFFSSGILLEMQYVRCLTRSAGDLWVKVEKLWLNGNNVSELTLQSTC